MLSLFLVIRIKQILIVTVNFATLYQEKNMVQATNYGFKQKNVKNFTFKNLSKTSSTLG